MTKGIKVSIKTSFGEIVVSGETPEEVLQLLQNLNPEFYSRLTSSISPLTSGHTRNALQGIVEMTREGPIIVTKKKLTHYEAIALILYCSKDQQCSLKKLDRLLISSGIKVTLPARLHEMRKRGLVLKPNPRVAMYKLTFDGIKWVEEELLPRLAEFDIDSKLNTR